MSAWDHLTKHSINPFAEEEDAPGDMWDTLTGDASLAKEKQANSTLQSLSIPTLIFPSESERSSEIDAFCEQICQTVSIFASKASENRKRIDVLAERDARMSADSRRHERVEQDLRDKIDNLMRQLKTKSSEISKLSLEKDRIERSSAMKEQDITRQLNDSKRKVSHLQHMKKRHDQQMNKMQQRLDAVARERRQKVPSVQATWNKRLEDIHSMEKAVEMRRSQRVSERDQKVREAEKLVFMGVDGIKKSGKLGKSFEIGRREQYTDRRDSQRVTTEALKSMKRKYEEEVKRLRSTISEQEKVLDIAKREQYTAARESQRVDNEALKSMKKEYEEELQRLHSVISEQQKILDIALEIPDDGFLETDRMDIADQKFLLDLESSRLQQDKLKLEMEKQALAGLK
ncbi:hypothetical protein ADUPG1_010202 [Aduncisulcus paluster]|uniref:Uncharacterized protein n=1 Tax=Aduncisulcus paluster TaxID=2918883 RepID=A0ABQ5JVX5_9EUKA|nr:hypothetical protein ADUPG1_010202 [Aduncisulcus paluster]